ncbi:S-layer homology domain-containing protein [Paenibacillus sp. FSL M8-0334]|uniref:S-layer homology domain-containing protein n=1 Tax=Paenibacillus sp. FSL M8-0334 TaxID=2921623 RepID=UPI0030F52FA1
MIEIVSPADPSFVITEKRTADANGNWELPLDDTLNPGAYTITVSASNKKTQSEPVNRQFVVVDKTALENKVTEISNENLVQAEYTPVTWQALQDALDEANRVLNDGNATQQQVDDALTALEDARSKLERIPAVNKTALENKVTEINNENLVQAEYTPATWQALQDALDEANRVLNDGNATQQQVDDALTALEDARSKLERIPTVNKTALENKVTEISNENLVEAEYTPATWQALQDALDEANRVLNDGNATQQQVDDALTALEDARSKLERIPTVNKTALENKVTEINNENLVQAEYTPATWQALQDALDEANRVLNDGNATQEQVNKALQAVRDARNALARKLIIPSTGALHPNVSADVYEYSMNVDYSTTELRFTVNPVTPDATITLNGIVVNSGQASEAIALNVGSNEITMVITEKDGTTSTYTINVTRAAAPNGGGNNGGGNGGNSGNNGGSGNITTPPPSPAPSNVERITVNVEASGKGVVAQTVIERTSNADGTKSDKVTFESSKATEAVQKTLAAGSTAVRIVIPDENDEVKDVRVELPVAALKTVHESGLHLEIFTDNGMITIPNASLRDLNQNLYFHLVPIKQVDERKQVEERAKKEQLVREVLNDGNIYVVDRPFTIETNMPSRPVQITLPMNSSHIPADASKRALFLSNLAIFIEHSDGERKLVTPELGEYAEGVLGLTFEIGKFSTFTILNLDQGAEGTHSAYMVGFPDGTFKPAQALTRAQIATILSRVLDLPAAGTAVAYPDVTETHWASEAIRFATVTGLMQGMPDGSFQPEKAISRAEMATIIARLQNLTGEANHSFSDVRGHWAEGNIANVYVAGYMEGMPDGSFQPNKTLTRAEAVVVFNRLLQRGPLYEVTASWTDVATTHWAFHHIEEASRDHSYITRNDGGETIVE